MFRTLFATTLLLAAAGAQAQATIDQNKALAGGVTPGDAPGFPITLSVPGHYKLMGNLKVPAGVDGVEITAPEVTLDLNGFTLSGSNVCTQNSSTKVVTCSQPNTGYVANGVNQSSMAAQRSAIRNGTIKGFTGRGIYGGDNLRLERLDLVHNGAGGYASMQNSELGVHAEDVLVELNGGVGFAAPYGNVSRMRVGSNGGDGIWGSGSLVVRDSLVRVNHGIGLNGVSVTGTRVSGNGVNRVGVKSMGGNLDDGTSF